MDFPLDWVSSLGNSFNYDYAVSFHQGRPGQKPGCELQFRHAEIRHSREAPGISVFTAKDGADIFRTYSTYSRGLDMLNGAYHLLDITALGRHEDDLPFPMAWVKLHDEYAG